LIAVRTKDIRYQLAEVLHSEQIQTSFDRIIIDAPPRLTTACVQAFCASTHVLIPTVLDQLSAQAVGSFADQLRVGQCLWPYLQIVGVVGTMLDNNPVRSGVAAEGALKEYEVEALVMARDTLQLALETAANPLRETSVLPTECFIPQKTELGRSAGNRIAYAVEGRAPAIVEIRDCFDRLGDEIDRRIAPGKRANIAA
jgi:cellulose biosynthesis protein BcsQ